MQTIEISELGRRYLAKNYRVLRINCEFDLDQINNLLKQVVAKYPLKSKDRDPKYQAVGLQYFDATNPFYDSVDSRQDILRANPGLIPPFIYYNEIGKRFEFIQEKLATMELMRGRILRAFPGIKMPEHTDGDYSAAIHIPVQTCEGNLFYVEGEPFHLPANGSAFLINTSRPHYIVNQSEQDRIHLMFYVDSLSPFRVPAELREARYSLFKQLSNKTWQMLEGFAREVISRDNFECQYCGASTPLTIALSDYRRANEIIENHQLKRALTICLTCEFGVHGLVRTFNFLNDRDQTRAWLASRTSRLKLHPDLRNELGIRESETHP